MPKITKLVFSWKVSRYLLSGGTASLVQLGILYLLTDVAGIWYLLSSTLASIASIAISFTLQKFWTFQNTETAEIKGQVGRFLLLYAFNLVANAFLMYSFVDILGLYHIVAQVFSMGIIATYGFFAYRYLIFQNKNVQKELG